MKKRVMRAMLALLLAAALTAPLTGALASEESETVVPVETSASEPEKQLEKQPEKQPEKEPEQAPAKEPEKEPAAESSEEAASEPAAEPTGESTNAPTTEPTGEPTGEPTTEPTGEPTTEPTGEPTTEPTTEPTEQSEGLSAKLKNLPLYVRKGDTISFGVSVSGGVAPYSVTGGGSSKTLQSAGEATISAKAAHSPETSVSVTVTDAAGNSVALTAKVPTATEDRTHRSWWFGKAAKAAEDLSGDWGKDILKIAQSQLGYAESKTNFVIHSDGVRQGYSIYGDYYGLTYTEWCAMFAAYCVEMAGMTWSEYPRDPGCWNWVCALIGRGAYMDNEDTYEPQPGDLIFINWEGKGGDADHIGIVERTDGSCVYTIEGNCGRAVRRNSYYRSDRCIIGYGNTGILMAAAKESAEKPTEKPAEKPTEKPVEKSKEKPADPFDMPIAEDVPLNG